MISVIPSDNTFYPCTTDLHPAQAPTQAEQGGKLLLGPIASFLELPFQGPDSIPEPAKISQALLLGSNYPLFQCCAFQVGLKSLCLLHPLQEVHGTWEAGGCARGWGRETGKNTSMISCGRQSAQLWRTLIIFWWCEGFSAKQISSCRRNLRLFSKACCSSNYQSGKRAERCH